MVRKEQIQGWNVTPPGKHTLVDCLHILRQVLEDRLLGTKRLLQGYLLLIPSPSQLPLPETVAGNHHIQLSVGCLDLKISTEPLAPTHFLKSC